jgi:hypothetical protein
MTKQTKAKKSGSSSSELIDTMKRGASILRKQAQTGKIDRAYFIYFADLETSLENFPR